MALDLRWTWSHATDDIWRTIDSATWDTTHNPWIILQSVPHERLETLAEVYLDDLEPGDVAVELFAEPASPGAEPVCVQMHAVGPLPGTSHGHLFSALVPADRPVSDYTPRIVPAALLAAIPLELPLIAWHH